MKETTNGNGSNDIEEEIKKTNEEEKNKSKNKSVPFLKLFSFADPLDYLLMIVGSIGAIAHGASIPVFFIFFGKLINLIGVAYLFPRETSHDVGKVIFIFNFLNFLCIFLLLFLKKIIECTS